MIMINCCKIKNGERRVTREVTLSARKSIPSKNNFRGITMGIGPIWGITSLTFILSCSFLRLVFTSDGVGVGVVSGVVRALIKIKNRSRKRSHKRDGIGVRRIRTFPFSYDSVAYVPESERCSH